MIRHSPSIISASPSSRLRGRHSNRNAVNFDTFVSDVYLPHVQLHKRSWNVDERIARQHLDLPPKNWPTEKVSVWCGHGGLAMGRKNFTAEQIIFKLREVEVLVGQGESIAMACRKIAVTEQTYYRWRKEYGGMGTDQLKRLKELEKENARLRRAVADLSLEKIILAEAAKGNF